MIGPSLFKGNTADAGGAIMLSGVGTGPTFLRTSFTANHSPRGGAVYSVSSGTATDDLRDSVLKVYKDCFFTDNRAKCNGWWCDRECRGV